MLFNPWKTMHNVKEKNGRPYVKQQYPLMIHTPGIIASTLQLRWKKISSRIVSIERVEILDVDIPDLHRYNNCGDHSNPCCVPANGTHFFKVLKKYG